MRELFIYYRSPQDEAGQVASRVQAFQARLTASHAGLAARLMCRPDVVDGVCTWMETYAMNPAHSPEGISPALTLEIEQEALCLSALLIGLRHIEVFATCA